MSGKLRIHGPSKHGTYGVSEATDVFQELIGVGSSEDEAARMAIETIAAKDKVDVSQVMIWRVPGNLPFPKDT
jgi:hypothetical protein